MRGWALAVAVVLVGGASPAGADANGKAEFLRWVGEIARAKKLSVCQTGELRHPGEAPGYFAALGDAEHDEPDQVVLLSNGKQHWAYAERAYTLSLPGGCESPPVLWQSLPSVNVRGQDMATNYFYSDQDVTFVEGEPAMLEHGFRHRRQHLRRLHAGDRASGRVGSRGVRGADRRERQRDADCPAARLALAQELEDAHLRSVRREEPGRDADADLAVQALDLGKAGYRIIVDVTDDRAVPTPVRADARKLIRSYYLELWWVPRDARDARQLGIGMRADGSADVRWLIPSGSKEKLPVVRRTRSHFEIDLPLAAFGNDAPDNYNSIPFTVAFSDTDAPGAKQQTVVATSPVHWNDKETFGKLTRIASSSRRFPVFGDPMDCR